MAKYRMSLEEAYEQAKASAELEGFVFTEADKELILKVAKKEISHEEFIQRSLDMAKKGQ